MELALFSFGTLMDTELLELVCDQAISELVLEPAQVRGFQPYWVENDHFPVLVAEQGSVTHGLIIRGLNELALQRIVFFEGDEFALDVLWVTDAAGQAETVNYFADTQRLAVSKRAWMLQDWQHETKTTMLPRVRQYMQCFGKISVEQADAYW